MATSLLPLLFLLPSSAYSQSLQGWGVSGGSGPRGGIGDGAHPVYEPLAYITDGLVPTTPNTTRQLARGEAPVLVRRNNETTCGSSGVRKIVVDSLPQGARQEMLGFGHSWTDSAVDVFDQLEPELRDQVMEDLFGQHGNNMGFMRHTVGSSDLSFEQYSYDDNGPSFNEPQPDPDLSEFSLGPKGTRMAEYLAMMGEVKGDVFLYGTTWSYPGWMKNNHLFIAPDIGGSHFLLNNSFNPAYMQSAINYYARYVDAYAEFGVKINGMSPQNEPLNYIGGTTTMYLSDVDQATLLTNGLGTAMHERGVKIMAYDHNTDEPVYPARVIQGAGTDLVDSVAWHCYQGPVAEYSVLEDFRYNYPSTAQFMTECSNTAVTPGEKNFWVAQNFMPSIRYGAGGASMWVMATDPDYGPRSPYGGCETCLGSIIVNSSTEYTKQIDYYMIGHFSRFIRRGSRNYHVLQGNEGSGTDWDSQFYSIAVQNPDGGWAVVILNNMPEEQHIELSFTGSGFVWEGTVPENTLVTWMLPSDAIAARRRDPASPYYVPAPYAMNNETKATTPYATSTRASMTGGTGTWMSFGTATSSVESTCPPTGTTSSTVSSDGTLLPVPNTTHSIENVATVVP